MRRVKGSKPLRLRSKRIDAVGRMRKGIKSRENLATKFENSQLVRWVVVLGLFGALAGNVVQTLEFRENRRERIEASKARYWQILTNRAPGNSGKIEALEYLTKHEISLNGINLSCRYLGGMNNEGECISPTHLQGLDFSAKNGVRTPEYLPNISLRNAQLDDANLWLALLPNVGFYRANLQRSDVSEASLCGANFREANLSGAALSGSDVRFASFLDTIAVNAELSGANFAWSVFHGTDLSQSNISHSNFANVTFGYEFDVRRVSLNGSNVSGADFSNAKGLEFIDFTNTWAWADEPPIGLPQGSGPGYFCMPKSPLRPALKQRPLECFEPEPAAHSHVEQVIPRLELVTGGFGALQRLNGTNWDDVSDTPTSRFPERCSPEVVKEHTDLRNNVHNELD